MSTNTSRWRFLQFITLMKKHLIVVVIDPKIYLSWLFKQFKKLHCHRLNKVIYSRDTVKVNMYTDEQQSTATTFSFVNLEKNFPEFFPIFLVNGWVFVYELCGCGFESCRSPFQWLTFSWYPSFQKSFLQDLAHQIIHEHFYKSSFLRLS